MIDAAPFTLELTWLEITVVVGGVFNWLRVFQTGYHGGIHSYYHRFMCSNGQEHKHHKSAVNDGHNCITVSLLVDSDGL